MTSRKIVVVDKNEDSRIKYMNKFESSGYIVLEAEDGKQVIELLSNWEDISEIDLIVFNIHIPKADDVEAIKLIIRRFPSIPITLVSEHTDSIIFSPFKSLRGKITFVKPNENIMISEVQSICI